MNRYEIGYKEKKYISKGENALEAFEKFAGRKVFGGNNLIENYSIKQYDADTRGVEWAQYKCGWPSEGQYNVLVSRIAK